MGLPIQKAPKHKCKLSDGTEVTFRPFLVKEQKYLLLAKEGKSAEEVLLAIRNLITSITEEKVNAFKLPMFDLEYLFLKARAKSVGETSDMMFKCKSCDGVTKVPVNIEEVELHYPEGKIENTIQLTDTLGVTLRYPDSENLAKADDMEDSGDRFLFLIKHGIHTIFDEETVYDTNDIQDSELTEFVESLTLEQVDKINVFFESMPTIQKVVEYKCDSCGTENESILKGLQNFF